MRIYGGFQSMGDPLYRWLVDFMENPFLIWMMKWGTTIYGNHHLDTVMQWDRARNRKVIIFYCISIYVIIYIHITSCNNIGICEVCLKMGEIPLFGGWINPGMTKFTGIVHGFPTWFSNQNDSWKIHCSSRVVAGLAGCMPSVVSGFQAQLFSNWQLLSLFFLCHYITAWLVGYWPNLPFFIWSTSLIFFYCLTA